MISCLGAACKTTGGAAAGDLGQAQAGVFIPGPPAVCERVTPHAALTVGLNPVTALDLERAQTDNANADKRRCGAAWRDLKNDLAQPR